MRSVYIPVLALAFVFAACSDDDGGGNTTKLDGMMADKGTSTDKKVTQLDKTIPKDKAVPKDTGIPGTLGTDQICDPTAKGGAKACKSGMLCVRFSTAEGICLPSVTNCTSGKCATGRTCLSLSSGAGVCGKDCSSVACPTGTECQLLSSVKKSVCTPPYTGPKTTGQICKSTDKTYYCKKDLICLRNSSTSTSGYCAENCTTSGTCASLTQGTSTFKATCFALSSGTKVCVFDCSASGAKCPTGLSCTTVSTNKFCLAP